MRDVNYFLHTRQQNEVVSEQIWPKYDSIQSSHFNSSKPTRFLIHGYLVDQSSQFNVLILNSFFAKYDFNVIVVDWGKGAITKDYCAAK